MSRRFRVFCIGFQAAIWMAATASNPRPASSITLTESPAVIPAGGNVTVTWSSAYGYNSNWIGLYPTSQNTAGCSNAGCCPSVGPPNCQNPGSYFFYANTCTQGAPGPTLSTDGFCSYTIPSTLPPGTYNFRLFNTGPQEMADSNSFTVIPVANVSVTPNSGVGTSQTFQFAYADTLGAADIGHLYFAFVPALYQWANACVVQYVNTNNTIGLLDNTGSTYAPFYTVGTAYTLQNSQCSVDASGVSFQTNGILTVPVTFKPAFSGSKITGMYADSVGGTNTGWQQKGTWTVCGTPGQANGSTCYCHSDCSSNNCNNGACAAYSPGCTGNSVSVDWSNSYAGVSFTGGVLKNITAGGSWNTSAAQAGQMQGSNLIGQGLSSGNGYMEFSTNENTTYKMAGLSHTNVSMSYTNIDYAIYSAQAGALMIFESGVCKAGPVGTACGAGTGTLSGYVAGDVFRVAVESGIVKYYKNGVLLYTSGMAPTYPLFPEASLFDANATITNAVLVTCVGALPDQCLLPEEPSIPVL